MTVAVMKALHSPIPLILDALFASFPPNYLPQSPPPSVAQNKVFYTSQRLANTTLNKYTTLSYKLLTQLVYTYPSGHLSLGGHPFNFLTIYV